MASWRENEGLNYMRTVTGGHDNRAHPRAPAPEGVPGGTQHLTAAVELALADALRGINAVADLLRQPGAPLAACKYATGEAAEGSWISAIEFAPLVGIGETSACAAMAQCARGALGTVCSWKSDLRRGGGKTAGRFGNQASPRRCLAGRSQQTRPSVIGSDARNLAVSLAFLGGSRGRCAKTPCAGVHGEAPC
jgi:hypothetical protein